MKHNRLFCILAGLILLAGCSSQVEKEPVEKTKVPDSDEAAVEAVIIEYIERVKEGDKTVLYENELSYYVNEVSMSEYMEVPRVRDYPYDSLSHVVVDSIAVDGDVAIAQIRIFYESAGEEAVGHTYTTRLYRSGDRWLRPYQSRWEQEVEYRQRVKEYEEATKAEEAEQEE